MADRTFSDLEQQLIVRLSDDSLAYMPTAQPGWQCRLDDIAWPSSVSGTRGLTEVRLHAADGRVAARIPQFEQIERLYVALVRQLAARPQFDMVRESLPAQVGLLERTLWLAAQDRAASAPWEALAVAEESAVAAGADGLLFARFAGAEVERLTWPDLAGVRSRGAAGSQSGEVLRFYAANRYFDVEVEPPGDDEWLRRCAGRAPAGGLPAFRLEGVTCAHPETALDFSWELEAARRDSLLQPDETVLACAFGQAVRDAVEEQPARSPMRTELILTDRRLLRIDRQIEDGALLAHGAVAAARIPRMRRDGHSLFVGREELAVDEAQLPGMIETFWQRYRGLMARALDPFTSEAELEEVPPLRRNRPDPFAPEVQSPAG